MKSFCNQYNVYLDTHEAADRSAAYDFIDLADSLIVDTRMQSFHYYTQEDGVAKDAYYRNRIADGIVDSAYFSLNSDGITRYMYAFDYFYAKVSALDEIWGVKMEQGEDGKYSLADENIYFRTIEYRTGTIEEAPAAAPARLIPLRRISDMPMIEYSLEQQLKKDHRFIKVGR